MNNLSNRLGFKNKDKIVDARNLIRSERSNSRHYATEPIDARNVLTGRSKPKFTIPTKTIDNDVYKQKKIESTNFNVRRPNDLSHMRTTSDNSFRDSRISHGIFSGPSKQSISPLPLPIGANKRRSTDSTLSYDKTKRHQSDNFSSIQFKVINERTMPIPSRPSLTTAPRPPLTTSSLASRNTFVSPIQGYRIEVKNLHPHVNVDDVHELFTSFCGDLRSCSLIRAGYAEVVFRTLAGAQKSIEEFHGRELDNRPMNVTLVTPAKEPISQGVDENILAKIAKMQAKRRAAPAVRITKEAIVRSMYPYSVDPLRTSSKPFKFSVTL